MPARCSGVLVQGRLQGDVVAGMAAATAERDQSEELGLLLVGQGLDGEVQLAFGLAVAARQRQPGA